MFIDPIIMQLPEGIDAERFVIATYYCASNLLQRLPSNRHAAHG